MEVKEADLPVHTTGLTETGLAGPSSVALQCNGEAKEADVPATGLVGDAASVSPSIDAVPSVGEAKPGDMCVAAAGLAQDAANDWQATAQASARKIRKLEAELAAVKRQLAIANERGEQRSVTTSRSRRCRRQATSLRAAAAESSKPAQEEQHVDEEEAGTAVVIQKAQRRRRRKRRTRSVAGVAGAASKEPTRIQEHDAAGDPAAGAVATKPAQRRRRRRRRRQTTDYASEARAEVDPSMTARDAATTIDQFVEAEATL